MPPTDANIVGLLDPSPAATFYPMSRKLFVNRWVDPALPEAVAANFTSQEALYNSCFKSSAITNARVSQFNFLPIPTGPAVDNACPNNR